MATVYLAHDLRHGRNVAIKVLHPELSAVLGPDRFLKEIELTASLQHPHILPLFDSGSADGLLWYVMPFVEGESLRARLDRERQLPVVDALRIAADVAGALEYAHRKGVVHRDIKPENILLHEGRPLVADFGIALAVQQAGGQRMTQTGMSLGTPQYMAPEQAMGEKSVDARADLWALGVVLHEMLAGEPPFTGPNAQAIVAKILTEPAPSVRAARATVPPHVDTAILTALARLPADRFQSAAEFAQAIATPGFTPSHPVPTSARPAAAWQARAALPMAVMATAALALAAYGWLRPEPAPPVTRTFVAFPAPERFLPAWYSYTLTPDGSRMVYVGRGERGTQLWVKARDALRAVPLAGTEGASGPFTSPDGRWVAFLTVGRLMKVPIDGGNPVTVATAPCPRQSCGARDEGTSTRLTESGVWLDDGRIAFQSVDQLLMVSQDGGALDTIVTTASLDGLGVVMPAALPGGRALLVHGCTLGCNRARLYAVSLADRAPRLLLEDALMTRWSPTGHLLYVDPRGDLFAVPFDPEKLELTGPATRVLENVAGHPALSRDGRLLYLDGSPEHRAELVVVDPGGRAEPVDTTWRANFESLAVSPDGRSVAVAIVHGREGHIWTRTLAGGAVPLRLTFGEDQNGAPSWTADGSAVRFTRFLQDSSEFRMRRADGVGEPVVIPHRVGTVVESEASRDGRWLLLRHYRGGARDIYAVDLADGSERVAVGNPADDYSPALSPDGKWLAHVSEESGRAEVWVVPFPDAGGSRWQVTTTGGTEPAWSRDGRELYFVAPGSELRAVPVRPGPAFSVGPARTVMSLAGYARHPTHRAYEALEGGRFLMIRNLPPAVGDLVLVENWFTELQRLLTRK